MAIIAYCSLVQVGSGDCPHTLFYGPNGAGKKTLIQALLREIYGAGADKVCSVAGCLAKATWSAASIKPEM